MEIRTVCVLGGTVSSSSSGEPAGDGRLSRGADASSQRHLTSWFCLP
jgi:hypothetical protein